MMSSQESSLTSSPFDDLDALVVVSRTRDSAMNEPVNVMLFASRLRRDARIAPEVSSDGGQRRDKDSREEVHDARGQRLVR